MLGSLLSGREREGRVQLNRLLAGCQEGGCNSIGRASARVDRRPGGIIIIITHRSSAARRDRGSPSEGMMTVRRRSLGRGGGCNSIGRAIVDRRPGGGDATRRSVGRAIVCRRSVFLFIFGLLLPPPLSNRCVSRLAATERLSEWRLGRRGRGRRRRSSVTRRGIANYSKAEGPEGSHIGCRASFFPLPFLRRRSCRHSRNNSGNSRSGLVWSGPAAILVQVIRLGAASSIL